VQLLESESDEPVSKGAGVQDPFALKQDMAVLVNRLKKRRPAAPEVLRQRLVSRLQFAVQIGHPFSAGSRILDVGCGLGDDVRTLLDLGYDAYGVDVLELWDSDFGLYWEQREKPKGSYTQRLHAVRLSRYRLPFPDAHFDLAVSDQLFEHVFNPEEVFSEIARVLKPEAISLHHFPGPNQLMEGHIHVPVPVLCKYKPWVLLWAWAGRRSTGREGLTWKETYVTNLETMKYCRYPTKGELRRCAARSGAD
jgi:SAM-dependent methyltransferase